MSLVHSITDSQLYTIFEIACELKERKISTADAVRRMMNLVNTVGAK